MTRARGFILVAALWLAAVLALALQVTASRGAVAVSAADAARALAEGRAAAQGAVEDLLARLPTTPSDGRVLTRVVGDVPVLISIQDQRGMVDLGAAPASVLAAAFHAAGFEGGAAAVAVTALEALRANGPVPGLQSLRRLPGLDDGRFARLRRVATIKGGRALPDPRFIPASLGQVFSGGQIDPLPPEAPRRLEIYAEARPVAPALGIVPRVRMSVLVEVAATGAVRLLRRWPDGPPLEEEPG
jgi:hypothetical protein